MFCGLREKELRLPSPTSRGVVLIGKPHLFHIFQRLTVTETQIRTLWSASQNPMQSGLCHLSDPHFLLLTLLTQLQLTGPFSVPWTLQPLLCLRAFALAMPTVSKLPLPPVLHWLLAIPWDSVQMSPPQKPLMMTLSKRHFYLYPYPSMPSCKIASKAYCLVLS